MADAIKRLKVAEAEEIRAHFEPGKAAGEKWAREKALPSQLKRLSRRVSHSGNRGEIGTVESYIAHAEEYGELATCLCWDLLGSGDDDTDEVKFWEEQLGKQAAKLIYEEGFAAGFIVGALWVWDEFKASAQDPVPSDD